MTRQPNRGQQLQPKPRTGLTGFLVIADRHIGRATESDVYLRRYLKGIVVCTLCAIGLVNACAVVVMSVVLLGWSIGLNQFDGGTVGLIALGGGGGLVGAGSLAGRLRSAASRLRTAGSRSAFQPPMREPRRVARPRWWWRRRTVRRPIRVPQRSRSGSPGTPNGKTTTKARRRPPPSRPRRGRPARIRPARIKPTRHRPSRVRPSRRRR